MSALKRTEVGPPPDGSTGRTTTRDLGLEAAFFLFAFRACAAGRGQCCVVVRGFDGAFGTDARRALDDLALFTARLGHHGRRTVTLSHPGCINMTTDELCLINALADAQSWRIEEVRRRLEWVFAGPVPDAAMEAFNRLASTFACHGFWLPRPAASFEFGDPAIGGDYTVH